MSGGASRSKFFQQIQADHFQLPVEAVASAGRGGACGVGLIAGVGAGLFKGQAKPLETDCSSESKGLSHAACNSA